MAPEQDPAAYSSRDGLPRQPSGLRLDLAEHIPAVVEFPGFGQLFAGNPECADGRNPELVPFGGYARKFTGVFE